MTEIYRGTEIVEAKKRGRTMYTVGISSYFSIGEAKLAIDNHFADMEGRVGTIVIDKDESFMADSVALSMHASGLMLVRSMLLSATGFDHYQLQIM